MFPYTLLSWSGQEMVNQSHSLIKWRYLEQRNRHTSTCATILKLSVSSTFIHTCTCMCVSLNFHLIAILVIRYFSCQVSQQTRYCTLHLVKVTVDCYDSFSWNLFLSSCLDLTANKLESTHSSEDFGHVMEACIWLCIWHVQPYGWTMRTMWSVLHGTAWLLPCK